MECEVLIKIVKAKENFAVNDNHNYLKQFDDFLSPQMKQSVIITNKHGT